MLEKQLQCERAPELEGGPFVRPLSSSLAARVARRARFMRKTVHSNEDPLKSAGFILLGRLVQ